MFDETHRQHNFTMRAYIKQKSKQTYYTSCRTLLKTTDTANDKTSQTRNSSYRKQIARPRVQSIFVVSFGWKIRNVAKTCGPSSI